MKHTTLVGVLFVLGLVLHYESCLGCDTVFGGTPGLLPSRNQHSSPSSDNLKYEDTLWGKNTNVEHSIIKYGLH